MYNFKETETKWQKKWDASKAFKASSQTQLPKKYILSMFPYPSALGLHVGHCLPYSATDVLARYYRMKGFNVLQPMGWDAFGLPTEQHAIETGKDPAQITKENTDNFRSQFKSLGISYDWDREVNTSDPKFYHWTQWIFIRLYEKGLAYQANTPVHWCPALKTVLANDEIIDGKSERGGHPVEKVMLCQWMLKITDYSERLLKGLDTVDWPESIKEIQRNWIGKSVGTLVTFQSKTQKSLEVFTTRVDTLYGVTFIAIAADTALHLLNLDPKIKEAVQALKESLDSVASRDRGELTEKIGISTGISYINPATKQEIPLWVVNYVFSDYGTGIVMGVPGHDQRDQEFAQKYEIPIQIVIDEDEKIIHSGDLSGLNVESAQQKALELFPDFVKPHTTYKMRDWLFSRQRFWGEPIPLLKKSDGSVWRSLNPDELPLTLPQIKDICPQGFDSPLKGIESFHHWGEDPKGHSIFRETHTMPGSAGSSWYFLRYTDPFNPSMPFSLDKARYWMPVDIYIGGQEHAVGHLLYARFWTHFLYDLGLSPVEEPFKVFINPGMVLSNGHKMSKSKGNGLNPDDIIQEVGADSLRMYILFMGPFSQSKEWNPGSLMGVHRLIQKIHRYFISPENKLLLSESAPSEKCLEIIHKNLKKISSDIEKYSFNTCISQLMITFQALVDESCQSISVWKIFLKILSPFAPHLAEELWSLCGEDSLISLAAWPEVNASYLKEKEAVLGVQFLGKFRGEINVPWDSSEDEVIHYIKESGRFKSYWNEPFKKIIFVPNRIINFI